jgi:hypothetical protein
VENPVIPPINSYGTFNGKQPEGRPPTRARTRTSDTARDSSPSSILSHRSVRSACSRVSYDPNSGIHDFEHLLVTFNSLGVNHRSSLLELASPSSETLDGPIQQRNTILQILLWTHPLRVLLQVYVGLHEARGWLGLRRRFCTCKIPRSTILSRPAVNRR